MSSLVLHLCPRLNFSAAPTPLPSTLPEQELLVGQIDRPETASAFKYAWEAHSAAGEAAKAEKDLGMCGHLLLSCSTPLH